MCGIAGCVMPPGRAPDREALERMAATLRHRGPDDRGIEVHENVGLVATRLAIVDPGPSGHQPMWDPSEQWLLAFNGEVYNHRALRGALRADGWSGHGDTETLAAALAEWGAGAVERCNGPMAVAALDRPGRRLFLTRDRFGKKPLYLARHDGGVWFASEMRALVAAGVPARPRPDVLAHTAIHGWACGTATPLAAIDRLAPATLVAIDIDTSEVSQRRWYEPGGCVDPRLARELEALRRDRLTDRVEEALREAVRSRLMADVPVGTMCSGGLDSSLVTALAREHPGSLTAFNCSLPDEPAADEARWGRRVADALDIDLETIVVSADAWRGALVGAVRDHEYPLSGPSSVTISLIGERARQRGVRVLLTGEGADELFAGYPLAHARPELRFLPPRVIRRRYGTAVARRRIGARRLVRAPFAQRGVPYVDRAAAVVAESEEVSTRAHLAYAHHHGPRERFEAALLGALTCSQFPFLLNRMDKDAMAASVETRVPFLDPVVVRLALNLPLEARTTPRLKGVLRDVGRRHLPAALADRPKYPGMFFDARRRIEEAARAEFLADGVLRQILELPADRWREVRGALTSRQAVRLWTAEIWARLVVEGHDAERVEQELWA